MHRPSCSSYRRNTRSWTHGNAESYFGSRPRRARRDLSVCASDEIRIALTPVLCSGVGIVQGSHRCQIERGTRVRRWPLVTSSPPEVPGETRPHELRGRRAWAAFAHSSIACHNPRPRESSTPHETRPVAEVGSACRKEMILAAASVHNRAGVGRAAEAYYGALATHSTLLEGNFRTTDYGALSSIYHRHAASLPPRQDPSAAGRSTFW